MPLQTPRVLLVTAEASPFAVYGDLAEMTTALACSLHEQGCSVAIALPYYRAVRDSLPKKPLVIAELAFLSGGREERGRVLLHRHAGIDFYFIENNELYDREGLYHYRTPEGGTQDYTDNLRRFSFLSRAVLEMLPGLEHPVRMLHCYAWHAALVPIFLKTLYAGRPGYAGICSLLTVPNISFQGLFPADQYGETGLPGELFSAECIEYYGMVNLLKGGILFADRVSTVSANYAREVQSERFGYGLDGVMRRRGETLVGIHGGIDTRVWNPAGDPLLGKMSYAAATVDRKMQVRRGLFAELQLPDVPLERPLVAFLSRLEAQKGLGLIEEIKDALLERDCVFLVQSSGSRRYVELLRRMAMIRPERMVFIEDDAPVVDGDTRQEALRHRILAAADLLLLPAEYEPGGEWQLRAQAYGTLPIVHATGVLADTVQEGTNGFVFHNYQAGDMLAAIDRALAACGDGNVWRKLQTRTMEGDYSWARPARRYLDLYREICGHS